MRLVRQYKFEAAHMLHHLPEEHPCSRLHGHGYRFEVTVEGTTLDHRSMLIEYSELDAIVQPVLDRYDHRYINDFLKQPTVEVMVEDIWLMLQPHVTAVRLWETERSSVMYP
jgi:6-pyruvoyltetrahydropterin/6-carboxytetrahydropterin synthase